MDPRHLRTRGCGREPSRLRALRRCASFARARPRRGVAPARGRRQRATGRGRRIMRQKDAQRFIPWLATGVAVAALLSVHFAAARPGGGSSYSGGGRSGGSYGGGSGGGGGGSGGGGELILYAFFWLLSEHPLFGIPLLILAAWIALRQRRDQARRQAWSSAEAPPVYVA